ncbi:hypothetical protein OOT00_12785 [Desulfobotulus sp. H1]|uniref:Uncharacterized protein n=1 Tax=Desulfobotulus pelophilus TaxID=2823377 RepID=A0ABT3NBR5_9BACT|nr:hypothetical protein [Desulfobotulus pelophilus]MCW7754860.1 hypothetical protein [Desulfobotulus pelophilus]
MINKQELQIVVLWALVGFLSWLFSVQILFSMSHGMVHSAINKYPGSVFPREILLFISSNSFDIISLFIGAFLLGFLFRPKFVRMLSFYMAYRAVGIYFLMESLFLSHFQNWTYGLEFIEYIFLLIGACVGMFAFAAVACFAGRMTGLLLFARANRRIR